MLANALQKIYFYFHSGSKALSFDSSNGIEIIPEIIKVKKSENKYTEMCDFIIFEEFPCFLFQVFATYDCKRMKKMCEMVLECTLC